MNLFQNKSLLLNFFAIVGLTLAASYFVISHNYSAAPEQVQFASLTNADIDKILAIKAEMQAAKIEANLSF